MHILLPDRCPRLVFPGWLVNCSEPGMKSYNHFLLILALIVLVSLNSCSVITGIFKAGMGFGIFLVLVVIGLIIFFFSRMNKS